MPHFISPASQQGPVQILVESRKLIAAFGPPRPRCGRVAVEQLDHLLPVVEPEQVVDLAAEIGEGQSFRRGEGWQGQAEPWAGHTASRSTTACWTVAASMVFLPPSSAASIAARAIFWTRRGMPRVWWKRAVVASGSKGFLRAPAALR